MLFGHVLLSGGVTPLAGRADVADDALAAMETLDDVGSQSEVELAPDLRVGDRVVVPVDFHMVLGNPDLMGDSPSKGQALDSGVGAA